MKLYIAANGYYVGTQVEAKKLGKQWQDEDVPVDKQGLITKLNQIIAQQQLAQPARGYDEGYLEATVSTLEHVPVLPPLDELEASEMRAARMAPPQRPLFSTGSDVDAICEAVEDLDGFKLGQVAMSVCGRLQELTKETHDG